MATYVTMLISKLLPVSVSPLSIKFAARTVGTSSAAQTVVLTNDQSTTLTLHSITLGGTDPGDFSEKTTCKPSVLTGADCTISVTFKPTATGSRTATLNIADSVGTQSVALSGTGK